MSSVFVRNLPYDGDELELKDLVKAVGLTPKKCVIVKDEKGENKGFGFFYFNLSIDAETAVKRLNQQEFKGRRLLVELAKEDFKYQKKVERKNEIMVRGVSFAKNIKESESSLKKFFGKFGVVNNVRIPASKTDKTKHGGYAFVEFQKDKSASLAVEKANGKELDGHTLIVDFKLERDSYLKQKSLMIEQLSQKQKIEKELEEKKKIEEEKKKKEEEKKKKEKKEKKKPVFELSDEDDEEYSSDDNEEDVKLMQQLVGDLETESSDSEEDEEGGETEKGEEEKPEDEKKFKEGVDVEDDFEDSEVEMFDESEIDEEAEEEVESGEEEEVEVESGEDQKEVEEEEEEEVEESEEEADEEPVKTDSKDKKKQTTEESKKEDLSKTVFLKNLPFDATQEQITKLFSKFGEVQYVAIVKNKQTKQPSGTAFVKYNLKSSLEKLFTKLEEEERLINLQALKGKKSKYRNTHAADTFVLNGRAITVLRALEKEVAVQKKEEKEDVKDKRNLSLLKIGYVHPKSEEAALLPPAHLKKIQANFEMKKKKLKGKKKNEELTFEDPNFSISRTRLCVFNIHKDVTEKDLKALFKEMSPEKAVIKQIKIVKEKDTGKSKGFGFVEFEKHEDALVALQKVNNNVQMKNLLLLVEFAVENAMAIQKLQHIMERGKVTSQKALQLQPSIVNFNKFKKRPRNITNDTIEQKDKKRKH